MAQEFERIQLEDGQEELVTGGRLKYISDTQAGHFVYSRENPDVKYTFNFDDMIEIRKIELSEMYGQPDEKILATAEARNLIHRIY